MIVIGSSFDGLFAAKKLQGAEADVTLIDRTNHHLFQPLLYQVAAGTLSPDEIAPPTCTIFNGIQNVHAVKGDVTDIDVEKQVVTSELGHQTSKWEYDHLLVATGVGQPYFGNDHFAEFILGMKDTDDAPKIRVRIIGVFERVKLIDDPAERKRLLTFVVVGTGPTGAEFADQLAELANRTPASSYCSYNPCTARVVLPDGAPQVLPPFDKRLGHRAQKSLEKMDVIVRPGAIVTDVNEEGIIYKNIRDGTEEFVPSFCRIRSAGVSASPLGKTIAEQTGVETGRVGRVVISGDTAVDDHKNVYAVDDTSNREDLPSAARVAIQGGEYVVEDIAAEADSRNVTERQPFECFNKDSTATISRLSTVVKMGKVEVTGFIGWALWLAVHLMFLVGFRNRSAPCVSWGLDILDRNRWQIVPTRQQIYARNAIGRLAEFNKDKAEQDLLPEVHDTHRERRADKSK